MKREDFLANVRHSMSRALLPDAPPQRPSRPLPPSPDDAPSLLATFVREAEALQAQVYQPPTETAVMQTILQIFEDADAQRYLSWEPDALPLPNLTEKLAAADHRRERYTLPAEATARKADLTAMSTIPIGITGATAALAETGTVIVHTNTTRGRLPSLLPPIHIALLRRHTILPTIDHFFRTHDDVLPQASNLVFISGPSRTADIEQTLTLGVHGPKSVHIIMLPS